MPTMNVSLSREFVDFVEREMKSGEYGSASEVVRDGLRLLQREKSARDERLAILRREVGMGMEQAAAGQFSERSIDDIAASFRNPVAPSR